jgi:predicted nucleic acid-binding protein
MMKPLRVYVDTSVIGCCLDAEYEDDSRALFAAVAAGQVRVLVSEVTLTELAGAPAEVRAVLDDLPDEAVEELPLTPEMVALRDAYVDARIVGERWLDDAAHVAAATVARADALVSWNFRHLLRLHKMKAYNQVNLLHGYGILTIVTPKEVTADEPEEP